MENRFNKGIKYEIYIGIKDKDSYEEILSVEDFKNILCEICTNKEINFSLLTQTGGYKHGKGYTTETSLRIIIIGIDEENNYYIAEATPRDNVEALVVTKLDEKQLKKVWDEIVLMDTYYLEDGNLTNMWY